MYEPIDPEDQSTRAKILRAMYHLVAKRGYDKTSIAQICEVVGITKPSVYYYFSSKEQIFKELIDGISHRIPMGEISCVKDADDYVRQLHELGSESARSYTSDTEFRGFMAEMMVQGSRLEPLRAGMEEYTRQHRDSLIRTLQTGASLGVFPEGFDVRANAESLFVLAIGISDVFLTGEGMVDPVGVWDTAIDNMLRHTPSKAAR